MAFTLEEALGNVPFPFLGRAFVGLEPEVCHNETCMFYELLEIYVITQHIFPSLLMGKSS